MKTSRVSAHKPFGWGQTRTLGMEIDGGYVRTVEVAAYRGQYRLQRHLEQPIPPELMEGDTITDPKELGSEISMWLKREGFKGKNVHLSLPNRLVLIRLLRLPDIEPKQLRKLIDVEVQNNMVLPFEQAFYTYSKLDRVAKENDDSLCEVLFAAAPLEMINQYTEMAKAAGIKCRSINIRAHALQRLIETTRPIDASLPYVIVELQGNEANLSVIYRGGLRTVFQSQHDWNKPSLAELEAAAGAAFAVSSEAPTDAPSSEFHRSCDNLTFEIERLMSFLRYNLLYRDIQLGPVFLSGDVPYLSEIADYLNNALQTDVSVIDKGAMYVVDDDALAAYARIAACAGLALKGDES